MTPLLLALLASTQAAVPATPPGEPATCAALVRSDPTRAIETANAWRSEGGGLPARQCLGLAYSALGRWAEAAAVFEEAARDAASTRDPRQSDLRIQAANAHLAGGQPTPAIAALDAALSDPTMTSELRGEAYLDRARALVALDNLAGARQDLDRGLQLVPTDPFAWYLSAALASRQRDLPRARRDIAEALRLAPDQPDFLLLSGTLAGQVGDMAEAERLYRRVLELAPNSEAGRTARASLPNHPAPPAAQPQSR